MHQAGVPTLIPRTKLFGNPSRAQAKISADGRWLSWLAPKDGVLNVWVAPYADAKAARVITNDTKRGIRCHGWAFDSRHVLYMQDEGGTEEWHIYAVDVEAGTTRDLTPLPGVTAYIHDLVLDHPGIAAIAINDRDKAWHDLYRIDVRTGERELIVENRQELASIVLDRQLRPRIATKSRAEGGSSVFRMDGTALEPMRVVEHEDDLTTRFRGFTRDGSTVYLVSSIGRDKAALMAMNWQTGAETMLAEHPKADISQVVLNPETEVVEDIVGPSNLETLLATIPPYWAAFFENLARRVGDPRTDHGRALLRARSPLHAADRISKPLLIGQGANDPRVKQAESDQIIEAMRAKNLPVTYVLYPQEGHGFAVPENSLSFNAIAEAFLAAHLGGRCEAFGDDFRGAEFQVRAGAAHVPGLGQALAACG